MHCNRRLRDTGWQLPHRSDVEDCHSASAVPIEYAVRRQENKYEVYSESNYRFAVNKID